MDINEIIKHIIISCVCFIFFERIKPLNFVLYKKVILGMSFIVVVSSSFVFLTYILNIPEPYRTAILIIASSIVFAFFLKERIEAMITVFALVFASSYILIGISISFAYFITLPFVSSDTSGDYVRVAVSAIIGISFAILLRKIKIDYSPIFKRFASGIFLSISSMVIILYGLMRIDFSVYIHRVLLLLAGYIMLGFAIYSWFRRETTISKNENAKDVIVRRQQIILEQKEKDISVLKKMQEFLASTDHQNSKILDGMQRTVKKLIMRSEQTDVLDDAHKFLEQLDISRKKADMNFNRKIYDGKTLPQTGIMMVDSKFETVFEKAMLKSVDFDLEIHGDISGFNQVILDIELMNIIGDLSENAFNAIQSLDNDQTYRKIRFIMEKNDAGYELSVSDSGIPFNIDILLKLGTERVTSRLDDGGSGYGYERIFELLNEYGASLIITEYEPAPYDYSKNIAIRFDGKSDYIIKSFRVAALKKQNADTKFTIQNLTEKVLVNV